MTEVIVLRGLPASGKTTYAKTLVASAAPGAVARINNDDLVASMFPAAPGVRVDGIAEMLHWLRLDLLRRFIANPDIRTVVIDNTNLSTKTVRELEFESVEAGASFVVDDRFLTVPVEECLRRDRERPNPVGDPVILKMAKQAAKLKPWTYTARHFAPVVQDLTLPPVTVFDMDGTLAHKHPDRNWYEDHLAHLDYTNTPVVEYARMKIAAGDEIVIVSGRSEGHREATENWVGTHVGLGIPIFMRPAGDVRRDSIVKYELIHEHVLPNWHITNWVDDRNQVVNMVRAIGIPCWQVAPGEF